MANCCLGLYIEDNLIKYAKVSKNNEAIKVEAFGIKFYENLEKAIKQITEETYSFKIPISINATDEIYDKFEVFSLLSKKDIDDVVKTEFENICYERETNKNLYEQRYIITNSEQNAEKVKVINISIPKTVLAQRKNQFNEGKLYSVVPIGATIPNIIKDNPKVNSIIVNIEKNTIITKIIKGKIADINILPIGIQKIIENIGKKENSYSKAYEICKNTTIYTDSDKDLQYEENEYLVDIMPVLYEIVSQVKNITSESLERIDNIYITGTAAIINNIDIYFQDYFKDIHCEILKPSFISNNSKLNIKDYIEVNSAISIALKNLEKNNNINFLKESNWDKISLMLKSDISNPNFNTNNISELLGKIGKQYNVISITVILIAITYVLGSYFLNNQFDNKIKLAEKSIEETNTRIDKIKEYNDKFNYKTSEYKQLLSNIEKINNTSAENKRYKNAIPNLLNNIMAVIPKSVQLISIENTSDTHVVILAKSKKYEQIAFLKTKLHTEGILNKVVSDTGVVKDDYAVVTIEGELP